MEQQNNEKKHIMPPGTYYVGDPVFLFEGPTGDYWWNKLCDTMFKPSFNGFLEIEHISVWLDITTHGDGDYSSNKGRQYFVDSGMFGIVRLDNVGGKHSAIDWEAVKDPKSYYNIRLFPREFTVKVIEDKDSDCKFFFVDDEIIET